MCNIWQIKNPADLPVELFTGLNPDLKYINLTGGEPFLHPFLPEIVRTVHLVAPKAQIIISSNGLATELIAATMAEIMKIGADIGVRISLDGIGETHDRIRGIPGIYDCALETILRLQALGLKNLGLSFTIQDENKAELLQVYDLSRKLKVQLALALVQNSEIYFSKSSNRVNAVEEVAKNLLAVIRRELAGPNPKHWLRAFYDYGLYLYLTEGKRLLPTGAGLDSLFIDPAGRIYPSNLINLEMGELSAGPLGDTWNTEQALAVREKIKRENISESWIICTIRGEMKRHAIKVLWWVLKNKLSAFRK
jgi:MoaA/NifB/PqqE/SkfB family radical SAM enzyme